MKRRIHLITRTKFPLIGAALDDVRSNRSVPKGLAFQYLDTRDLEPRTKTLHILGTGPSINSKDGSHWDEIRSSDSFGLNFFLTHNFIPNILSMEFTVKPEFSEGDMCYFRLLRLRSDEFLERGTIIILKIAGGLRDSSSVSKYFSCVAEEIPEPLGQNLRFAKVVHFHPANTSGLENSLWWLNSRGFLSQQRQVLRYPQMRASIVFALLIGMRMNYGRIVLHGFDMGAGNHFFQDPVGDSFIQDSYLQEINIPRIHRTNDVTLGSVTVPVIVERLNRVAGTKGIQILNGTPGHGSPLDSFLPAL